MPFLRVVVHTLWNGRLIIHTVDPHHFSCSFEWNNFFLEIRTIRYSLPCEIYHFFTFLSAKSREKTSKEEESKAHSSIMYVSKFGAWKTSSLTAIVEECRRMPSNLFRKKSGYHRQQAASPPPPAHVQYVRSVWAYCNALMNDDLLLKRPGLFCRRSLNMHSRSCLLLCVLSSVLYFYAYQWQTSFLYFV